MTGATAALLQVLQHAIHLPQFLITWSIFFGCGMLVYVIYAIRKGGRLAFQELYEHCVPFNVLTEKSFHGDVKIYLIGKLTEGIIFIPVIGFNALVCGTVSAWLTVLFPQAGPLPFTVLAASVCTVAMFLVSEFSDFLYHFAEHKVPALWELHKVHHSAQSLNPLTSKRGHPLSMIFAGLLRSLLTGALGGVLVFAFRLSVLEALSLAVVASKLFVIATLDPLRHSHHPISMGVFDRLIISPHMHQIHHSKTQAHWDKNFGTNLSVFDWMFGTAYKPRRGEQPVYGIAGLSDETLLRYNSLHGAYVGPLVRFFRKARKSLGLVSFGRQEEIARKAELTDAKA